MRYMTTLHYPAQPGGDAILSPGVEWTLEFHQAVTDDEGAVTCVCVWSEPGLWSELQKDLHDERVKRSNDHAYMSKLHDQRQRAYIEAQEARRYLRDATDDRSMDDLHKGRVSAAGACIANLLRVLEERYEKGP